MLAATVAHRVCASAVICNNSIEVYNETITILPGNLTVSDSIWQYLSNMCYYVIIFREQQIEDTYRQQYKQNLTHCC